MSSASLAVHPALRALVRRIDVVEGPREPSSHAVLPGVYPVAGFQLAGRMGVSEHGRWRPLSLGGVTGLLTGRRAFSTDAGTRTVLVTLQPWSLPLLFGAPASHLSDAHVALDDLQPGASRAFDRWLGAAGADGGRFIQAFLLGLLRRRPAAPDAAVRAAVRTILRTGGAVRIDDLAEEAGVGRRRLERAFLSWIGLPPKTFAAIARFRAAHRALRRGESPADVAARAGFYDQSHLTNEFRRFSGLTPAALR